ncbi:amidohydrolase family protein [Microbacterium sp. 179-I 3D2 NHS]|uniref:amidohydrolase family protein n=1 Tax=Microbacterium sp. 179-I 3D2 NHS TaxID=3235178 RepID=UPI00399F11E2
MTLTSDLTYTDGVPGIDHHSHAGYIRPGARPEGIDATEREMALDHVEAQIPSDDFLAYVDAEREGDHETVAALEERHSIAKHFEDGVLFHSTSMHSVSLLEGARAMYGEMSYDEYAQESLRRRLTDPVGLYDEALKKAGTPMVLTDVPEIDGAQWSRDVYKPIARLDPYLFPFGHPRWVRRGSDTPRFRRIFSAVLQRQLDIAGLVAPPSEVADYVRFVRESIGRRQSDGFVGLKIASAYVRSLDFQPVAQSDAAAIYSSFANGTEVTEEAYKVLADYLLFEIAQIALDLELPIQVHTGVGHSEPGLRVADADPLLLQNFLDQPRFNRLKVILIHGGFPFTDHLTALAFGHGNVYLDMSLMPQMHGALLGRVLEDWLTYLPGNRVMFGTDTGNAEHHVSSSNRGRRALDRVLQEGVRDASWSAKQAAWLAGRVMHQNLADVYGVSLS